MAKNKKNKSAIVGKSSDYNIEAGKDNRVNATPTITKTTGGMTGDTKDCK